MTGGLIAQQRQDARHIHLLHRTHPYATTIRLCRRRVNQTEHDGVDLLRVHAV